MSRDRSSFLPITGQGSILTLRHVGVIRNLYARFLCSRAAARPSARATIGYLVYKFGISVQKYVDLSQLELPGVLFEKSRNSTVE